MKILRQATSTLTPVELQHGDTLEYSLGDGRTVAIEIIHSQAEIVHTTLAQPGVEIKDCGAMTVYRFWADVNIDGEPIRLEREVGTQKSFYEPVVVSGVRIWLDAVDDIFSFMRQTHGACRLQENFSHHLPPRRHVRLVVQDAERRICPEILSPWCPLPPGSLRIEDCYRGEDCWMGAYDGASAHGGLDINHPRGTPLFAPFSVDDQFLYHAVSRGQSNNRWRGLRRWDDGSTWVIYSSHMTHLTVPEHQPLTAGQQYAEGAGVWVGAVEHSHFGFSVFDHGELILLDPWILFWQMYQDQRADLPNKLKQ